jgi:hypothetical protein
VSGSEEVFDANRAEHDDGKRGDAVEVAGCNDGWRTVCIPGGKIYKSVKTKESEEKRQSASRHAKSGDEYPKNEAEVTSDVGSVCDLDPKERCSTGGRASPENLRCATQGKPRSFTLEKEEKRKRKRDARNAQGHRGHESNDDGECVSKTAREPSWKGRQLIPKGSESADVPGVCGHEMLSNGR